MARDASQRHHPIKHSTGQLERQLCKVWRVRFVVTLFRLDLKVTGPQVQQHWYSTFIIKLWFYNLRRTNTFGFGIFPLALWSWSWPQWWAPCLVFHGPAVHLSHSVSNSMVLKFWSCLSGPWTFFSSLAEIWRFQGHTRVLVSYVVTACHRIVFERTHKVAF